MRPGLLLCVTGHRSLGANNFLVSFVLVVLQYYLLLIMPNTPAEPTCGSCRTPARSNAKLHSCDSCQLVFHTACNKVSSIGDKTGKACALCIERSQNKTRSQASDDTNSAFNRILAELGGLNERLDKIETKLQDLDVIPGLVNTVKNHEAELEDLKLKVDTILARLNTPEDQQAATSSLSQDSALVTKVLNLEKKNAELSTRLFTISTARRTSTNLVIGGLSVPTGANLKALVLSVLSTVHADVEPRDVITSRLLTGASSRKADARSHSSPSPAAANGSTQVSRTSNIIRGSTSTEVARSPSILVTLSSRPLLESIIRDKAKFGKLHTSSLVAKLPTGLDANSITPNLININEFLPREIFELHHLVRLKSRLPNSGFTSYVRNGQIYVRRKKGDNGTLINTEDDLNRFLK